MNIKGYPNCLYAAYETKTGCELCIAVADTLKELGEILGISYKCVSDRLYKRNRRTRFHDYYVMRISLLEDEK